METAATKARKRTACKPATDLNEAHPLSLVPIGQVSKYLSVCPATLVRMAEQGEIIKPVRLRKRHFWRAGELKAWIEGGCLPVQQTAVA